MAERDLERSSCSSKIIAKYIRKLRWRLRDTPVFAEIFDKATDIKEKLQAYETAPKGLDIITIKVLAAQLSLLTSLIYVIMMVKMKPQDHVEKYRLKVKYIEEDLSTLEGLLGSYYIQGLVFGNISENKSVTFSDLSTEMLLKNKESLMKLHPYCKVLFELREQSIERVYKYASGQLYRPEQPTYDEFIKVWYFFIV